MMRRSFLLMAGGAGVLSPRVSGLHPLPDPPRGRNIGIAAGALCRGGPIRNTSASAATARMALPGSDIPKYVEPLTTLHGARVAAPNVAVSVEEFRQYVLPASFYPELAAPFDQGTLVWGYKVGDAPAHYPALRSRRNAAPRQPCPIAIICRASRCCSAACQ